MDCGQVSIAYGITVPSASASNVVASEFSDMLAIGGTYRGFGNAVFGVGSACTASDADHS